MKQIQIYDPAMCCTTGVCGPSVNPELLRVATVIESLRKRGASIARYNLASEPQAYVDHPTISALLQQDDNILPVTLVNGEVVKTKEYLTNQEFSQYTGLEIQEDAPKGNPCCGPGCCC